MNGLRKIWHLIREIERHAAPASTLLWACLAATALICGVMATAHAHPAVLATPGAVGNPATPLQASIAPWPEAVCHHVTPAADGARPVAWLPPLVTAGDLLPFAIELPPQARAIAYLPGLDAARVPLAFDRSRRLWRGAVSVPAGAPVQGHFTLRVVAASGAEYDVRVPLSPDGRPATLNL